MKSHYRMFAHYNQWANRRLYEAAGGLADADYRADRGAFFGSLHGTLNHLLVADRIWMARFTNDKSAPTKLDAVVHDQFEELRAARNAEDNRIMTYVDGLTDADLVAMLTYRTITSPRDISQPLAPALAHFFNHQTHHRGQAHCLMTQIAGNDAMPPLDLLYFQRETGTGLS
ncbi:MAG: damage-inducible protein DinB [Hyphomicrobiales bacterium]|nr:damage-inducible protein DinB [Hyphomicrobiales bacterium]